MPEADPEERDAPDEPGHLGDHPRQRGRVSGAVGEEHRVRVLGEEIGRGGRGEDLHPTAGRGEQPELVGLDAAVQHRDAEPVTLGVHVAAGGRHLDREGAPDHARPGGDPSLELLERDAVGGQRRLHGAAGADVPDQRTGVDAVEGGHTGVDQRGVQAPLGAVIAVAPGELPGDEAGGVDATGLVVLGAHAVVAHLRGRHHHDLLGVGGIGEDLLVPAHRGVEDNFPNAGPAGTVPGASEDSPVLEEKVSVHRRAGFYVDRGARATVHGRGSHGRSLMVRGLASDPRLMVSEVLLTAALLTGAFLWRVDRRRMHRRLLDDSRTRALPVELALWWQDRAGGRASERAAATRRAVQRIRVPRWGARARRAHQLRRPARRRAPPGHARRRSARPAGPHPPRPGAAPRPMGRVGHPRRRPGRPNPHRGPAARGPGLARDARRVGPALARRAPARRGGPPVLQGPRGAGRGSARGAAPHRLRRGGRPLPGHRRRHPRRHPRGSRARPSRSPGHHPRERPGARPEPDPAHRPRLSDRVRRGGVAHRHRRQRRDRRPGSPRRRPRPPHHPRGRGRDPPLLHRGRARRHRRNELHRPPRGGPEPQPTKGGASRLTAGGGPEAIHSRQPGSLMDSPHPAPPLAGAG